ncbi:hypothetical protein Dalk_3124 [Desulfatibacillum aliphaticivorans]|uniref:Uncharacterized protein n=1 Tax=Desulfatibacillum aliphaticivorans TaxID=218208 RepID=B8FBR1_DESAL|nr:hypothetical protein Dalk_3124 [Desulfatibacillum aliphaticivorans]
MVVISSFYLFLDKDYVRRMPMALITTRPILLRSAPRQKPPCLGHPTSAKDLFMPIAVNFSGPPAACNAGGRKANKGDLY